MKHLKLFENFIEEDDIPKIFYHNTDKNNLDSILKNGLIINHNTEGKTTQLDHVKELYGCMMPIFITSNKNMFKEKNDVILEINTTDLNVVSDIPSFEDWLSSIDGIWRKVKDGYKFNSELAPDEIYDVLIKDCLTFNRMLTDKDVIKKLIYITQTAAILENVSRNRIKIV